jgi:hypothetical protein
MKCLSTRTRPDGMKARRYELEDGTRITTLEIPVTVIKGVGMKKMQQQMATWQRGEKQRTETHARRKRIEELLRERIKPLAIAHEVGVTETRVRQIRKEMGL